MCSNGRMNRKIQMSDITLFEYLTVRSGRTEFFSKRLETSTYFLQRFTERGGRLFRLVPSYLNPSAQPLAFPLKPSRRQSCWSSAWLVSISELVVWPCGITTFKITVFAAKRQAIFYYSWAYTVLWFLDCQSGTIEEEWVAKVRFHLLRYWTNA